MARPTDSTPELPGQPRQTRPPQRAVPVAEGPVLSAKAGPRQRQPERDGEPDREPYDFVAAGGLAEEIPRRRTPGPERSAAAPPLASTLTVHQKASAFRTRILPRSLLGVTSLILAFAIGAGFSGVVLFSYYQYKLNQTDNKVNALESGYKKTFANAEGDLNGLVSSANTNIQQEIKAVQQLQASPAAVATLVKELGPSVFFVSTEDASGQPSVGSAFVISSNATESLLITSYTTIQAATQSPGPAVYVSQGGTTGGTQVTVQTTDPTYDLALLILDKGGLPALTAAPTSPAEQPGDRLYAISGLGSAGASITQGTVVDVSANGLALDLAIGTAFQGGPIVNQSGQVVAVASRAYAPDGFSSTAVYYAPYVEAACRKVLTCPGGTLVGSH